MKLKKTVYIILTMFLGLELMFIVHRLLEYWYTGTLTALTIVPPQTNFWIFSTYLPPIVPIVLIIAGLLLGYRLGQTWWRIVYIEKRHWRWKKASTKRRNQT